MKPDRARAASPVAAGRGSTLGRRVAQPARGFRCWDDFETRLDGRSDRYEALSAPAFTCDGRGDCRAAGCLERCVLSGGDDQRKQSRERLDPQRQVQGRNAPWPGGQARRLRRGSDQGAEPRRLAAGLIQARPGAERRRGRRPHAPCRRGVERASERGRGVTSTAKTGDGQYQAIFDRDVRNCTYFATLGDESAAAPGTGQISVTSAAANVNGVRVVTRNSVGDALVAARSI